MDRGTRVFWALIAVLLGASLYFGIGAQASRRALQPTSDIASGELVRVKAVVDGDTVVVERESGAPASVRLVGVKAFGSTPPGDDAARFGKLAVDELGRLLEGQPLRVVLHSPPRDRHGRTLAHLFVGEVDVGLALIKRGAALTYTVYPFASMALYAEEQAKAQAERRGLWADPKVAERALLLERQWARERD